MRLYTYAERRGFLPVSRAAHYANVLKPLAVFLGFLVPDTVAGFRLVALVAGAAI